jgi:hypothetical protein
VKQQIIDQLVRQAFEGPEFLDRLYGLPEEPTSETEALWAPLGIAGQDLVELCRNRTTYIKAVARLDTYSSNLLLEARERFQPIQNIRENFTVPKGYKRQSNLSPSLWYHRLNRGVLERLVKRGERYPTIEIHMPRPTNEIFPWQNAISAHYEIATAPRLQYNWPSREVLSRRYVRIGPATAFEMMWLDHTAQWQRTSLTIAKVFVPYASADNEQSRHEVAMVFVSTLGGADKPDFDEFLSSFQ